ncbi:protein kinase domain-containing protein [Chitinophaga rhizophila]|uniref:Protein kinase n=1 Tax=Chitinophaga rhizophila TaxID=2866212 RepID=A0ABS7GAM9_9BACT|nr:protein kinase [Chitinophaga rhizophila]MBW8684724.1 protein kinase [Chitinophaga rhizophila]
MLQYPGLEKAFELSLKVNDKLLTAAGVKFIDDHIWLRSGNFKPIHGWLICLSVRTASLQALLHDLLPILKDGDTPFRIIRNEHEAYRMNAGLYGPHLIGKGIQFHALTEDKGQHLINRLLPLTRTYTGCVIQDCIRISNIIYAQEISNSKPELTKGTFPFTVEKKYRKPASRKLVGLFYLPVEELSYSPKGTIYKGFNFKRPFKWCLIKQGNSHTADDHFGRDIRDKLRWQKKVIKALEPHIRTPKFIDLAEYEAFSFLVLEYIDGIHAGHWLEQIRQGKTWKGLRTVTKKIILEVYLSILVLVKDMHDAGYVHRDINERNFIIDGRRTTYIIDFEMACCLHDGLPDPPFTLGTIGYMSPEQMNYMKPHFGDDVYSLGALLAYFLTGELPDRIFFGEMYTVRGKLQEYAVESRLSDLIIKMTDNNHLKRATMNMAITQMKDLITFYS